MSIQAMKSVTRLGVALFALLGVPGLARAQWTQVNNVPMGTNPSTCLLLTDGTVMCQANEGGNGWLRLTPDNTGSYENGNWTSFDNAPMGTDSTNVTEATPATCAPCAYSPTYYASAVLPDGRVVVIGGEYNLNSTGSNPAWTNIGFLFDPTKPSGSQWSVQLTNPFGYGFTGPDKVGCTGDSQSVITQTGTMLIANVCGFSNAQIASFDPSTLTFTAINPSGKSGPNESNDEENWTILPGGNIFSVDSNTAQNSEIYDPTTNSWGQAVDTAGIKLSDIGGNCNSRELGPAVALANGTIIQFSGNPSGQNALYTIATNTWASNPGFNFPSPTGVPDTVADGPASLLVNGHALVIASPACVSNGAMPPKYSEFNAPIHVYEFNGTTLTDVTPSSPGTNGPANNNASFVYRMLLLPSGRVLVTHRGDGGSPADVWTYTPAGGPDPSWAPGNITAPSVIGQGQTYVISGTQFNGFSQGASYGDDAQMATNWPLVRITNTGSGHVFYARTHDHSRMGVEAVGDADIVSTNFDVPANLELGASTLVVVTNGIPSAPVNVNVEMGSSLAFTGASATSSDFNDAATVQAQLTSGGSPVASKNVTFVLGSGTGTETCSGTTDSSGLASCSITPNQPAGGYTITATFDGDSTYAGSSTSAGFTILHEQTAIAFTATSATNADFDDAATVQVQLTTDGSPLASEPVTISLGSGIGTESCSGSTDSGGLVSCSITPNQQAGAYTITASFAGDAFYASSSASAPFTINKEETTTKFTVSSPTVIANGHPTTFSATLLEDGVTPIQGRTISIAIGSQSCFTLSTDATGTASCTITLSQTLGPGTVTASFAGDPYYLPSSASESVIVFAFLNSGSMVIGNLDGNLVEFWGAQWARSNSFSGGPAPNSFKGFASTAPQSCGGGWTGSAGDSSGPPATVPSYMGVVVSSSVAQSGSTISGDVPKIVVVQTYPGYGPDPGHAGTGTVVATYCGH
jgi:Bacterial Ig-like domain (group 3)